MFKLKEIIKYTKGKKLNSCSCIDIGGVCTDTRTLKPGALFIALKGDKFDGHDYLVQAQTKRAGAAIVEIKWAKENAKKIKKFKIPVVGVGSCVTALQRIAKVHRKKFKIPIIAVTGSNGKTTTKEMIALLLESRFKVLKSKKSFNNHIGVPLTLLDLNTEHEAAVIEIGMNHPGEIRSLASIVGANIAVITNVGQAHIEFFSSIEQIIEAKCELLENLPEDGLAIVNADDANLFKKATEYAANVIGFGKHKRGFYRISNISAQIDGVAFTLNQKFTFKLPMIGVHNAYNALGALAVAEQFNIDMDTARQKLQLIKPTPMRMQLQDFNGIKIISDCYNANPQSTRAAIKTLAALKNSSRRIMVLGDMLELGAASGSIHTQLGVEIAHSNIEKLVTIGHRAAYAARSALNNGMDAGDVRDFPTNKIAAAELVAMLKPEDIVLFKASRAMHLEEVIDKIKKGF